MWLLDTNVVSHLMRNSEVGRAYRKRMGSRAMGIAWMSYGELLDGALRAGWEHDGRLQQLIEHLTTFYTLVEMDLGVFEHWAFIRARRAERPIATDDALIAATALRYDVPLVTHNPADFIDTGVRLVTLHQG